jgi:hypothetical protein
MSLKLHAEDPGNVDVDAARVHRALGVTSSNARARSLYERVGFRAAGTVMVRMPDRA